MTARTRGRAVGVRRHVALDSLGTNRRRCERKSQDECLRLWARETGRGYCSLPEWRSPWRGHLGEKRLILNVFSLNCLFNISVEMQGRQWNPLSLLCRDRESCQSAVVGQCGWPGPG